jgi:hypothetical protein
MVAKVCALWFVALIALPFTAPFSTVDVIDLMNQGCTRSGRTANAPQASPVVQDHVNDTNDAVVSLERSHVERLRRDALTIASCDNSASVRRLFSRFTSTAPTVLFRNVSPLQTSLRL